MNWLKRRRDKETPAVVPGVRYYILVIGMQNDQQFRVEGEEPGIKSLMEGVLAWLHDKKSSNFYTIMINQEHKDYELRVIRKDQIVGLKYAEKGIDSPMP